MASSSGNQSGAPAGVHPNPSPYQSGAPAGLHPNPSDSMGLVTRAEACRRNYSIGVMRVDVWSLGPSPMNRAVSDKYMHALGRQIMDKEGFSRMRYNKVTVLDVDPINPSDVYEHAHAIAKRSGGRVAAPRMKDLNACLTKNHLVLFLQAMASGQVVWDDTNAPMTIGSARVKQDELIDTLKHGVWVEKISHKAAAEDPEGVNAIIAADNLDQAFSLTEHEMELVNLYMVAVRAPLRASMTAWNSARAAVAAKSSGKWADDDHVAAFNFAKETDPVRLQALRALHFHFVNPQALNIPVAYFELVRDAIPSTYQWIRMSLLAHAYQTSPDNWVSNGGKYLARGLVEKAVQKLGKDADRLKTLEGLLEKLLRSALTGLPDYGASPLHLSADHTPFDRLKPALACLHRFGKMAMTGVNLDEKPEKLANIEIEMRKSLRRIGVDLPSPCWPKTRDLEQDAGDKELQSAKRIKKSLQPATDAVKQFEVGNSD